MDQNFANRLRSLAQTLAEHHGQPGRGLIGFDGFVDEITDVVDTRTSPDQYTRIPTIAELAGRIGDAAGLSTNLELVPTQVKLGGNGPILANALTELGLGVTYIGCVGDPTIHPVFADLADRCRVISIAEPGYTSALEFSDGKLMLGKHASLKDVNWEQITARVSVEELREETAASSVIAAVNWTMLPYLTQVWQHFLDDVLAAPAEGVVPPITFFDLADPAKREKHELREAIRTIQRFATKSRPILGLNRKEATEVADAIGLEAAVGDRQAPLDTITEAIGEALGLYAVVVHPSDRAAVYQDGRLYQVKGPYTSKPLLTTGAGDNFNAGFCLGAVMGLAPEKCLILGTAVSGYYVRNRNSPSKDQLARFLHTWADHGGQEF